MVEPHNDDGAAHSGEAATETDGQGTPPGSSAAQPAPEPKAADRGRNPTLWLVIDSALIVLIAVGAYYFFYTTARQTYIAERNYRLLNAAGRQFETRFDALLTIFDSATSECNTPPSQYPNDCKQKPPADQWECCVQHSSLRLGTMVQRADCGLRHLDPSLAIAKGKGSTAYVIDAPMGSEKELYISAADGRLCGTVVLSDLIDFTLASKMFDRVLLVNRSGETLYQRGPKLTHPSETHSILDKQWRELCPNPAGESKTDGKDEPARNSSTQPVPYAQLVRLTSAPSATCDPKQHWMIIGLIPATRAFAEPMAVPPGLLIPTIYLLLLALLAWPLVKLWQMSPMERLRALELHVLVLAGLTATGMLTFAIFSWATEATASARLDKNLRQIAKTLQWRFQDEMHCAVAQLNEFSNLRPGRQPIHYYPWFMNLVSVDGTGAPARTFKPVDEDGNGWQIEEAPNIRFNVSDRPYFRAARAPHSGDSLLWTWTIPPPNRTAPLRAGSGPDSAATAADFYAQRSECLDDDPGNTVSPNTSTQFAIQPLVARSSGAMVVVLAVPNSAGTHGVGTDGVNTLATHLQSLTQPVLPVGFQFAVVDRDGLVQFHADPTRNLQENFFDETDNHRGLRAAVLTRHAQHLDMDYYAWPERAYVMPLKDTPWSLIVFHQQLMSLSLSIAVAIAWLRMWLTYLALYVVADVIVQWIRPRYLAAWLWPDRSRRYVFALLGLLLTVYLATQFLLQDSSLAAAVMGTTLAFATMVVVAPLAALAVVHVSSRSRPPLSRGVGILLGAAAGASLLWLNGYSWHWSLVGATVVFVALGYAAGRFPAPPRRNEWAFRCGYATATCALLLICGVLPATLFFRDAYEQSARNFEKYVQWRFADDLIQRATRVRREMMTASSDAAPGRLAMLVNDRLAKRWDIYDHYPLDHTAGRRADGAAAESQPPAAGFCKLDIVGPSDPSSADSLSNDGLSALLLTRPPVEDPFADLLPDLSAGAAGDKAWEWSAAPGHPLTIREQRLNEQMGAPGTCKEPLRIGWGLVPVRFTTGFTRVFVVAAGIGVLLMFGLTWTIVRFLFVLDADDNGWTVQDGQPAATCTEPGQLWSSMDDPMQKLALAYTARHGLPNPKNREAITALLRQGILVRRPELAIASPELCDFVGSSKAQKEIHELEKRIPPSDWSRLRGPLLVLVACFTLFLFGTQQGLVNSAAALVTGLTATVGAITTALTRLSKVWNGSMSGILSDGSNAEKKP